jgi:hypothetical protein
MLHRCKSVKPDDYINHEVRVVRECENQNIQQKNQCPLYARTISAAAPASSAAYGLFVAWAAAPVNSDTVVEAGGATGAAVLTGGAGGAGVVTGGAGGAGVVAGGGGGGRYVVTGGTTVVTGGGGIGISVVTGGTVYVVG